MEGENGPRYPIESVDNALRLLLMFGRGGPVRINAASRELDVASSTAHRLMAMLQAHRLVRQDEKTKAYVAGPALLSLSLAIVGEFDVRTVARPFLEKLAAETEETVALAVLEGNRAVFVDAVESPHAVRVASRVGMALPAGSTSIGKALLADLSPEQLRVLFPSNKLPTMTDKSIATRAELEAVLAEVRRKGYSVNMSESEEGVGSVGAPIRGRYGTTIAAVSIAGPLDRLKPRLRELCKRVVETADAIGEALR